jgi:predicted aspartyl protease
MRRSHLSFLIFLAFLVPALCPLFGAKCDVAKAHVPSEAESDFLHGEYEKSAALYQSSLLQHPNDPELTAGLVQALLRQQKVSEADETLRKALAAEPKSIVLRVALGEVQYRQGTPWLVSQTVNDAMKIDLCNPRLHLLMARLFRLNSMYASEAKELGTAHALDPFDPKIRSQWIGTLPLKQRIAELEAYLASPSGDDPEEIRHLTMYLDSLKKRAEAPRKACRLTSSTSSTEIPFTQLMRDATHVRAYGLDVKLNGRDSRLEIDTGASGLLVSRSVAQRAGLKPFSATELGGIGSEGWKNGYTAYADSIQVGSLEFHDCVVRVLDARNVVDTDGLIGMDVFARFLVTLDYPMRKLQIGPLPPRPDEIAPQAPSLATGEETDDDAAAKQPAANPTPAVKPSSGPHDRYIAPEMKGYTPIYRLGHDLLIPTSVNQGAKKLFVLDTGAWTTTISPQAAREIGKIHRDDELKIHGISGKVDQAFTANNVTLDFAAIRQPAREIVSFDTSSLSKHAGLEISGFIGATTLIQLTTHIDYRDGLIKFDYDPNRGYRAGFIH